MSDTTADYCAAIFTIGHDEPIGMFRSEAERLVALGFVRPSRRGHLQLTDRGNEILAKIEADAAIEDREFGDWIFSCGRIFSQCDD